MHEALRGLDPRIYRVVGGTFLWIAARMGLLTFLGIFLHRERGIELAIVGIAFLIENVMRGLTAPLAGAWSDRIGRRRVILIGLVSSGILLPGVLLIDDVWTLMAWSFIFGAAQGLFFAPVTSLLLDLAPPQKGQRVLALNYTALSLGYTLGVVPAGWLAAQGFGRLAIASAAAFLIASVLVGLGVRGDLPHETPIAGSFAKASVRALTDPAFMRFAAIAALFPVSIGLAVTVLPVYADSLGISEPVIGLILGGSGLVLAATAFPIAIRVERRGPFAFLLPSGILCGASIAAFAFTEAPWGFFFAMSVYGIGEAIFSAALPSGVAALSPTGARGAYQGAWMMIFAVGVGTALFMASILADIIGWRATWVSLGCLVILAGIILHASRHQLDRVAAARHA